MPTTQLYREIRSPAVHHILQTHIQKLIDWSNKCQMNFNTSKCYLLTITHKPKPRENHLKPVHLSSKLSPISRRNHRCQAILDTSSKSAKTLCLLKRKLYPVKPKVKEAAYNILVRPILEYGAIVWNPHTQNNIDTLREKKCIEVPPDS